jgi:hypothetical protein
MAWPSRPHRKRFNVQRLPGWDDPGTRCRQPRFSTALSVLACATEPFPKSAALVSLDHPAQERHRLGVARPAERAEVGDDDRDVLERRRRRLRQEASEVASQRTGCTTISGMPARISSSTLPEALAPGVGPSLVAYGRIARAVTRGRRGRGIRQRPLGRAKRSTSGSRRCHDRVAYVTSRLTGTSDSMSGPGSRSGS